MLNSPAARAAAHRLLTNGMPPNGTSDVVAAGAEQLFTQLFRNLSRWIGTTGCHVLFARAIEISAPHHPVLTGLRHQQQKVPHLDGLTENARQYGSDATIEGITAVLATIITILVELIGEDIAMNLLDEMPTPIHGAITSTTSDTALGPARRAGKEELAS